MSTEFASFASNASALLRSPYSDQTSHQSLKRDRVSFASSHYYKVSLAIEKILFTESLISLIQFAATEPEARTSWRNIFHLACGFGAQVFFHNSSGPA